MLEDVTGLSPKRLGRRLEEFWRESLPCLSIVPWEANPESGLTVALSIEPRGRRDVTDLGRVVESEPSGTATLAWSSLSPKRSHPTWRLLLHVCLERPVRCEFVVVPVAHVPRDARRVSRSPAPSMGSGKISEKG